MSLRQLIVCGSLLLAGGVVFWNLPLFHIRPLGDKTREATTTSATSQNDGVTDPVTFVDEVWNGTLRTGDGGTEIARLWEAFEADMSQAQSQFGRQAGLGGAWYFCVRGLGTVETADKNRVVLVVANSSRRACLELGVVVDNTVREAIGVKASDFPNAQDFNAISSELNHRVEQEVIVPNRGLLIPGAVVEFVGCGKVGGNSDLDPLCLIPIRLEVQRSDLLDAKQNDVVIEDKSP